jgi:hypothetical protein
MRRLKLHLHESQEAAAAAGSPSTHQSANEVALLRDELASALRTISDQVPSTPSETKPQTRDIILLQEVTLRALAAASSATTTPNKLHTRTPVTPGRSPSVLSVDEIQEEENRLERARRQLQRDRSALNAALERCVLQLKTGFLSYYNAVVWRAAELMMRPGLKARGCTCSAFCRNRSRRMMRCKLPLLL